MAYDAPSSSLQAKVKIRLKDLIPPRGWRRRRTWSPASRFCWRPRWAGRCSTRRCRRTTRSSTAEVGKKQLSAIINDLAERYPKVQVAATLDALKEAGFHWATRSGRHRLDLRRRHAAAQEAQILEEYEARAEKVQKQYERGLITDDERRQELIEIWTQATNVVAAAMEKNFHRLNPINMMIDSGARGNMMQVRQIAGMRGLVANPKGEIIPRPIKSNFREGLSVLEFFISTHGARKGLADTALRTADSGYLTRRLVDVSQDVIIREEDCGTERGLVTHDRRRRCRRDPAQDGHVDTNVVSRVLAEDVVRRRRTMAEAGTDLTNIVLDTLIAAGVDSVKVRSVLTCESKVGTCAHVLRPFVGRGQAGRHRRGHRHHRRPVDRRARHAAHDAYLPHRWCRG